MLQLLEERRNVSTPSPPPNINGSEPQSSPFNTPMTLRQIEKVSDELSFQIDDLSSPLKPDLEENIYKLIRGSMPPHADPHRACRP